MNLHSLAWGFGFGLIGSGLTAIAFVALGMIS